MTEHSHHKDEGSGGDVRRWVFWGFIAIAAFFIVAEHRAHLFDFLPFLLLAACPLMHLFHRHGGHGGHRSPDDKAKRP